MIAAVMQKAVLRPVGAVGCLDKTNIIVNTPLLSGTMTSLKDCPIAISNRNSISSTWACPEQGIAILGGRAERSVSMRGLPECFPRIDVIASGCQGFSAASAPQADDGSTRSVESVRRSGQSAIG